MVFALGSGLHPLSGEALICYVIMNSSISSCLAT